jgi:hypothetical protein
MLVSYALCFRDPIHHRVGGHDPCGRYINQFRRELAKPVAVELLSGVYQESCPLVVLLPAHSKYTPV